LFLQASGQHASWSLPAALALADQPLVTTAAAAASCLHTLPPQRLKLSHRARALLRLLRSLRPLLLLAWTR
jgi:hypothetical protein